MPSASPRKGPTAGPRREPTGSPQRSPTKAPLTAGSPTQGPVKAPTRTPSSTPVQTPTARPRFSATDVPQGGAVPLPTTAPTKGPATGPTSTTPTKVPSGGPSRGPSPPPPPAPSMAPSKGYDECATDPCSPGQICVDSDMSQRDNYLCVCPSDSKIRAVAKRAVCSADECDSATPPCGPDQLCKDRDTQSPPDGRFECYCQQPLVPGQLSSDNPSVGRPATCVKASTTALVWKWIGFKFRASWSSITGRETDWVKKLRSTILLVWSASGSSAGRPPLVSVTYVCPLDSEGRKPDPGSVEAKQCFPPRLQGLSQGRRAEPEAESKAELQKLISMNKPLGVFVEVAIADSTAASAEKAVKTLTDDLALAANDEGTLRSDQNPSRIDPLLIIDPITFIATDKPSEDLTSLHKGGGCTERACTAPDGVHSNPEIYNWREPTMRPATDLEKTRDDDDSSIPLWLLIVIIAGSVCLCLLLLLLLLRRKRKKRVKYADVMETAALSDEQHHMLKTHGAIQGGYTEMTETGPLADSSLEGGGRRIVVTATPKKTLSPPAPDSLDASGGSPGPRRRSQGGADLARQMRRGSAAEDIPAPLRQKSMSATNLRGPAGSGGAPEGRDIATSGRSASLRAPRMRERSQPPPESSGKELFAGAASGGGSPPRPPKSPKSPKKLGRSPLAPPTTSAFVEAGQI
eukprot:TRINITY_DN1230_c2_g2_i2.p1 TRINITY_DN1230_c2_g2~~TRINITY_DN1230_c2_g2_i2.p1  ORF type:complete len:774 (+),score=238.36 TRINITY_DN1230_c2_g2_i2:256-2322(+)